MTRSDSSPVPPCIDADAAQSKAVALVNLRGGLFFHSREVHTDARCQAADFLAALGPDDCRESRADAAVAFRFRQTLLSAYVAEIGVAHQLLAVKNGAHQVCRLPRELHHA